MSAGSGNNPHAPENTAPEVVPRGFFCAVSPCNRRQKEHFCRLDVIFFMKMNFFGRKGVLHPADIAFGKL